MGQKSFKNILQAGRRGVVGDDYRLKFRREETPPEFASDEHERLWHRLSHKTQPNGGGVKLSESDLRQFETEHGHKHSSVVMDRLRRLGETRAD